MRDATLGAVLQINAAFEPMSFTSVRTALRLVVKDKAIIVEDRGREIHPGISLPSVIRLRHYKHIPVRIQILTRKNILSRDGYTCMYCDKRLPAGELTLDHVQPQSRGGRDTWDNLVACCSPCNRRKADRTPEEAGMPLLRRPKPASIHTSRHILRNMGAELPEWRKYLFYDAPEHAHVTRGVA